MDSLLNDYRSEFVLESLVKGQTSSDLFEADFRNVRDPKINSDYIDFAITGDFRYNNTGCALKPDFLEFIEPKHKADAKIADRRTYSQIVVSESVATCWANQIAKSNIGLIQINRESLNMFLEYEGFVIGTQNFDSSVLKQHLPFFEDRFGPKKSLNVNLTFSDVEVAFGKGVDVLINYTMRVSVSIDDIEHEGVVLIDKFPLMTTANIELDDDMAYVSLHDMKLNIDSAYGHPEQPIYWYDD